MPTRSMIILAAVLGGSLTVAAEAAVLLWYRKTRKHPQRTRGWPSAVVYE